MFSQQAGFPRPNELAWERDPLGALPIAPSIQLGRNLVLAWGTWAPEGPRGVGSWLGLRPEAREVGTTAFTVQVLGLFGWSGPQGSRASGVVGVCSLSANQVAGGPNQHSCSLF